MSFGPQPLASVYRVNRIIQAGNNFALASVILAMVPMRDPASPLPVDYLMERGRLWT